MQCAVVLRVDVTIEPKLLENLLILSSQIYIYMNIKENFLSTTKFEWTLAPWLRALVPIDQWMEGQ